MPRFLQRQVEEDSKSLFIFYGGYRLRPVSKTNFRKSQQVSMIEKETFYQGTIVKLLEDCEDLEVKGKIMNVFGDLEKYDEWRSKDAFG